MNSIPVIIAAVAIGFCTVQIAQAGGDDAHKHHQHHHQMPSPQEGAVTAAKGATEVPPLRILFPESGAKVGTQLAIVFETPGEMARLTMSAPVVGTHLHIETDGISLMPGEKQLVPLGGNRYVFLFDLPVKAGERSLRVYWSDGMHQTIESSIQSVDVTVVDDSAASKK